jgi:predicted transcriptional regulator
VVTKKQTISVRLDADAKQRVERAARLRKQSSGAFLEQAGEEHARQVLLAWAVDRHRRGDASFSELAAETGLAVEEIMLAVGSQGEEEGLDLFLASCRTVSEANGNPDFLRLGEEAVQLVRSEHARESSGGSPSR